MTSTRNWTREELLLAINLYVKIPFGKIHNKNPDIIHLSKLLDRTPSSVSYKLANFASLDPSLVQKGASHVSSLDKEVWREFYDDWDAMLYSSEQLLLEKLHVTERNIQDTERSPAPTESTKSVKIRIKQSLFRKAILSSYNSTCCITGITIPELLVASHIVPWSDDEKNRLNPRNGLCLNSFHDKAFDIGILSVTEDYVIKISPTVKQKYKGKPEIDWLFRFHDQKIILPTRFLPDQEFLHYHNQNIFRN